MPCSCLCWLLQELVSHPAMRFQPRIGLAIREETELDPSRSCMRDAQTARRMVSLIDELCAEHPKTRLGRAPGDPERTEWMSWMRSAELLCRLEPTVFTAWLRMLDSTLQKQDRSYLLASGFSAADIVAASILHRMRRRVRFERFPCLSAWYLRVTGRPTFRHSIVVSDYAESIRDSVSRLAS